ncbi:MAG: DUF4430 domain-containing protein [Leptospirales bacterium]|jgi:hypothetical protein
MRKKQIETRPGLRRFSTAILTIALAASVGACDGNDQTERAPGGTVQIRVELPNGDARDIQTEVGSGATMLAVMQQLQANGALSFGSAGEGEDTLIDEIAGVKNGAPNGPYWIYAVNGRLANQGVGRLRIAGGDQVRWCYTLYETKDRCGDADKAQSEER